MPYNLEKLKERIKDSKIRQGILFCFGDSFISKVIQLKTRLTKDEIVPSHVAMIFNESLYESTSAPEKVGNKRIPSGVRRYLLKDFFKIEQDKNTKYYFYDMTLSEKLLDKYIHLPYGKDTIVDFLVKEASTGDSKGLICSQYTNAVTVLLKEPCPTPADLYRKVLEIIEKEG